MSLFGLVAVAGIAFDYARMVALDTELQNAADQAALAAATQLDDGTNACARASAAAVTFISNLTKFANDGGTRSVTISPEPSCDAAGNIRFYQDQAKTIAALSDEDAHFVEVTVNARQANFALTPIVAAFSSGNIAATAYAGMGSAVCGVEPLMICNPDEPNGNSDQAYPFDIGSRAGIGIELVDDEQDVPGNFGFLESGLGGASGLLKVLAYDNTPSNCLPVAGVETKPGFNASVMDGLNTRFDIASSNDCPGGGPCSSSLNARKDLVRGNSCNWNEPAATQAQQADPTNPVRYRPTSNAALPSTQTPVIMGHPRDICHAWGENASCGLGTRLGDGVWDRAAYFRSNHPGLDWVNEPGLGANVTRYQTYHWELEDIANRLEPKDAPHDNPTRTAYGTTDGTKCHGPGLMPQTIIGPDMITRYLDRRLVRAAVLNCKAIGVHGRTTKAPVLKWVNLFLVEPAMNRFRCDDNSEASGCKTKYTDKREVYVELVGEEQVPAFGQSGPPIFRRDVPYLIE